MGEKEEKRLYEIGSKISKLIRLHGLTNEVRNKVKALEAERFEILKTRDENTGSYWRDKDVMIKLDELELERNVLLKKNIEKCVREKLKTKKKRGEFEDPRDDELMSEIYPAE